MGCETAQGCLCIQHSCAIIYQVHTFRSNVWKNGSPINFNTSSNFDADAKLQEFMDAETDNSIAKHQKTAEVKANIEQAQKEHYDLKHGTAACFNIGSVVLKKDFTRKKHKYFLSRLYSESMVST